MRTVATIDEQSIRDSRDVIHDFVDSLSSGSEQSMDELSQDSMLLSMPNEV